MPSFSRRELIGPAFVTLAVLALNYPLVLQGRILASLDSEVYFYPNAAYLAASLRTGRIPLWDPFIFAGVPFLANSQVGALYPPNWLYLLGPVSSIANVLLIAHIVLFGVAMYCLARVCVGLDRYGATFAATVAAGGGLVGGMVGHINQVEALAWAPFTILLVEQGVKRSSLRIAALASIPMALAIFAGHTQVVYLTAVVAGIAGATRAFQASRRSGLTGAWLLRSACQLAIGPVLAGMISGAQLLPTLELTRMSIRSSGLGFGDAAAGSLPPPYLLISLLPTINQPPTSTEWIGYVSVSAFLLAAIAVLRSRRPIGWWLLAIGLAGLILAVGQYTPLYALAYQLVPGFRLFRVPARWLTVWVISIGLLAGIGADLLTRRNELSTTDIARSRVPLWSTVAQWVRSHQPIVAVLFAMSPFILFAGYRARHIMTWPTGSTLLFWLASAAGLAACVGLTKSTSLARRASLITLLFVELAVATSILPTADAIWPDAVELPRQTVTHLMSNGGGDRVMALGDNTYDPGDLAAIRAKLDGTLPPSARDQYVTALKHVEGLTPNLSLRYGLPTIDGYDGGILPLARYHDLKALFAKEGQDVSDGRLRIQLRSAPAPALLSWLNVRWLMMDRLRDQWIDGVYYDLGVSEPLSTGTVIQLHSQHAISPTRFGVMLRGSTTEPPSGEIILDDGPELATFRTSFAPGRQIATDKAVDPRGVWFWVFTLPEPFPDTDTVNVSWRGDAGTDLRALSAIDDQRGTSEAIVVSPALRYNELGDMKIYENTDVLPRAFLANGLSVQPSLDSAIGVMRDPVWQARRDAIAINSDVGSAEQFQSDDVADSTKIVVDDPEHIVVEASATNRRILVLTDSFYPGWVATVDGVVAPITPVDLLFRGVAVPSGSHVVEFTYKPISWTAGIALSIVGVLALFTVLVLSSRRPS